MSAYPNLINAGYCAGALEDPSFGSRWAPYERSGKRARESAAAITRALVIRQAAQRSAAFYAAKTR